MIVADDEEDAAPWVHGVVDASPIQPPDPEPGFPALNYILMHRLLDALLDGLESVA